MVNWLPISYIYVLFRQTADALIEIYQNIRANMIEAAQEADLLINNLRRLRRRSRQQQHRRSLDA